MFRKTTLLFAPAFLALVAQFVVAADPPPPASTWVSKDAIIVVEVPQPNVLLNRILSDQTVKAVSSLPFYKQQVANPEFQQGLNLIKYFEGRYNSDWRTLLGKLVGGGVTWAFAPDESSLLIVDAEDPKLLEEVHEFFLMAARGEATKQGQPDRVKSAEYRGVTGWRFGPDEIHAIIGNRLVLANNPEALKAALDRRAEPGGASFAKSPRYQAAKKAMGEESVARLFADMSVLKHVPDIQKGLEQNENPLATLLFAPLVESLRESTWVGMGVDVKGDSVKLEMVMDGTAGALSTPKGFALSSQPGDGAPPSLTVPRQIASFSFYRDLYKFYGAKDDLFPERTSGLIFFENMMGIFFTGRDLTEDVLAETTPEVRLVVAEQEYDQKIGTPQIQVPGFAAVFRMRNPEKFRAVAEEAWQKALGLINFTRGQQALPGLIIDKPIHGGTKYTLSYFAAPDAEDNGVVHARHNFQPVLAMPGEHLILSSSEGLARDLIDALKEEQANAVKPLAGTHSLAEVDGVQLASILEANRDAMVRQNMVEDGNTREEAESQIGIMTTVLKYIGRAKLNAGAGEGQSKLTLELDLNLP